MSSHAAVWESNQRPLKNSKYSSLWHRLPSLRQRFRENRQVYIRQKVRIRTPCLRLFLEHLSGSRKHTHHSPAHLGEQEAHSICCPSLLLQVVAVVPSQVAYSLLVFPRARVVTVKMVPEVAEEKHLSALKKKKKKKRVRGQAAVPRGVVQMHFSAKDALGRSLFGLLKDCLGARAVAAEYRRGS